MDNFATDIFKRVLRPWVPRNLITEEISGVYGNALLAEFGEIIKYYNIYQWGADFPVTSTEDFIPSDMHYKKIRGLIDKESRFMFAKSPDINLKAVTPNETNDTKIDTYRKYISEVLKENHFNATLVKSARDCLIGKRIAIVCNFNDAGIVVSFIPSLEFVYEVDKYNKLTKIITFYSMNDANNAADQRIYKKKYYMAEDNLCHVTEAIYDGAGSFVEVIIEDAATKFEYIPAVVILNDGLLNDNSGESEVANLFDYEQYYSKLSNKDIDAERQSMSPIRWVRDMSPESTKDLPIAPGSFWDLSSDKSTDDSTTGDLGILESQMSYSQSLDTTLSRINDTMYETIDMPQISADDLKGIVTSGKTLKAIYWGLIVRCDEKMMSWKYELELIIKCLIDGALLYPDIAKLYVDTPLQQVDYTIDIVNQYPLPEDENEEKTLDLEEVSNQTMSKKAYMKKWRNLTDQEADDEIKQIALERQMLDDSFFPTPNTFNNNN